MCDFRHSQSGDINRAESVALCYQTASSNKMIQQKLAYIVTYNNAIASIYRI